MNEPGPAAVGAARLRTWGIRIAVVGATTLFVGQLVNFTLLDGRVFTLDASAERNLWSWSSAMATAAAGFAALGWSVVTAPKQRTRWLGLGLVLLFFSLDDFVVIHERLGFAIGSGLGLPEFVAGRFWMLLYLPLVMLVFGLLIDSTRRLPRPERRLVQAGVILLVSGFALEAVGIGTKWLEDAGFASPHQARAGLEEGAELAAWIVIATGLVAGLLEAATPAENPVET